MANGEPRTETGQPTHPLHRDIRSPGAWQYFVNYFLLGLAAIMIVGEMIESGAWRKLGLPLLFVCIALANLARLQAVERKQVPPVPPQPEDHIG